MKHLVQSMRGTLVILWVIISTVAYASLVIIASVVSRKPARIISRIWARQMLALGGVEVSLAGFENISPGARYIFVSNHQSHLDIPCFFSVLPQFLTFLAKKELFMIPFFGWGITCAGHISINRSSARKARESFDKAVERLKNEDISLVIFPEGTRSPDGEIGEFKRGSFTLAVESGLPVLPMYIHGSRDALPKNKLLVRPAKVFIRLGRPIEPSGESVADKEHLMHRVRESIMDLKRATGEKNENAKVNA